MNPANHRSLEDGAVGKAAAGREAPRVLVVQDGARLRYALPLALQSAGILGTMHTDWYARRGSPQAALAAVMACLPHPAGKRLSGRRSAELDDARVSAPFWASLMDRLLESRTARSEELYRRRSRAIARHVLRQGWGDAEALAGFVRNIDPALCERARARGMAIVLDQMIAPIPVELRAARRQAALWPGWEKPVDPAGPMLMQDVERRSWAAADHITCASDYVREGLIGEGVEPERISVLPYPIDTRAFAFRDRSPRSGRVRIGFVGSISLRKGAPAFLRIARRFDPRLAEFVMVGPSLLDERVLARERGTVRLPGAVPASAIPAWLAQFDVFLFPSTCEGSAGAVMEAMAAGLPVVTTPQSGTLVREGIEGFVHDGEEIEAMSRSIARLVADPDLRFHMGQAARRRVEPVTIGSYGLCWRDLLERQLGAQSA
jgi:glycosyltransferase involved in cell wall biosynthesis